MPLDLNAIIRSVFPQIDNYQLQSTISRVYTDGSSVSQIALVKNTAEEKQYAVSLRNQMELQVLSSFIAGLSVSKPNFRPPMATSYQYLPGDELYKEDGAKSLEHIERMKTLGKKAAGDIQGELDSIMLHLQKNPDIKNFYLPVTKTMYINSKGEAVDGSGHTIYIAGYKDTTNRIHFKILDQTDTKEERYPHYNQLLAMTQKAIADNDMRAVNDGVASNCFPSNIPGCTEMGFFCAAACLSNDPNVMQSILDESQRQVLDESIFTQIRIACACSVRPNIENFGVNLKQLESTDAFAVAMMAEKSDINLRAVADSFHREEMLQHCKTQIQMVGCTDQFQGALETYIADENKRRIDRGMPDTIYNIGIREIAIPAQRERDAVVGGGSKSASAVSSGGGSALAAAGGGGSRASLPGQEQLAGMPELLAYIEGVSEYKKTLSDMKDPELEFVLILQKSGLEILENKDVLAADQSVMEKIVELNLPFPTRQEYFTMDSLLAYLDQCKSPQQHDIARADDRPAPSAAAGGGGAAKPAKKVKKSSSAAAKSDGASEPNPKLLLLKSALQATLDWQNATEELKASLVRKVPAGEWYTKQFKDLNELFKDLYVQSLISAIDGHPNSAIAQARTIEDFAQAIDAHVSLKMLTEKDRPPVMLSGGGAIHPEPVAPKLTEEQKIESFLAYLKGVVQIKDIREAAVEDSIVKESIRELNRQFSDEYLKELFDGQSPLDPKVKGLIESLLPKKDGELLKKYQVKPLLPIFSALFYAPTYDKTRLLEAIQNIKDPDHSISRKNR